MHFTEKQKNSTLDKRIKFKELDVNYFKTIDSEKKAYLLGLFVSDGHLSSSKSLFSISSIDYEIVRFFADEINNKDYSIIKKYQQSKYGTSIKINSFGYRLRIERRAFSENLHNLNITSGKDKLKYFSFDNVPKRFRFSFIRGVFDGDGCISYTQAFKRNKPCGRKKPTLYICSPELDFLKLLQLELQSENIEMKIYSDSKIHYLKSGSIKTSIKFYNYIYQNNSSLFLSRKKEKFHHVNTEVISETKEPLTP